MNARLLLSMPLLAVLTTFAAAFAPAPVFREPPKPSLPVIAKAMQGTWSVSKAKNKRLMRVRIEDKTWTNLSTARYLDNMPNGRIIPAGLHLTIVT